MTSTPLSSHSNKVKKALLWVAEAVQENPQKKRQDLLREAELRFDLTPSECQFLEKNFTGPPQMAGSQTGD
ncbi:MAG: hypothetical protein CSA34_04110 [Desulfobulbus propionicus]|nr:MAG: hypothetical protein CSA34_04110 [Desulfobulbus propionicus]